MIMTKSFRKMTARGFTLIEVIISLGVFGLIVSGLFSLMPWGVENVSKIKDRSTALGLVDAVQVELERLGFSIVEHGTKRLTGLYNPSAEPEDVVNAEVRRLILVSPRKGGRLSSRESLKANKSGLLISLKSVRSWYRMNLTK